MFKAIAAFRADQTGATSIEYALIAGLVSIVIVGAVTSIGTRLSAKFFVPVNSGLS